MLDTPQRDKAIPQDHIIVALRDCEAALRQLAIDGRLTTDALQAFVQLSRSIRQTIDRRKGGDRRTQPRETSDRRFVEADEPAVVLSS